VLYIDSPGGEVTASDSIYNAVRKVRDGGFGTKKPVVVYMGSLAASGGYYVACGGSWLMANETTLTGSIGVIMQSFRYQELFGKVGLEMITFKSGQFKDMLSGSREMTQEERDYVQKMIMDTYGKFVGIVARERKLPENELRTGLADGRVISGKDARDAKLINATGELEDAYAKAMELGKAKGATIIRYESPFKLARLFRLLGQSEKTNVEVNVTRALMPKLEAGRLYFLPSFYAP
jgi:protease-4